MALLVTTSVRNPTITGLLKRDTAIFQTVIFVTGGVICECLLLHNTGTAFHNGFHQTVSISVYVCY